MSELYNIEGYKESEDSLFSDLFGLPKMKSLDGFLYLHFSHQIDGNIMFDERRERLDSENYTYRISLEEEKNLIDGEFENLIKSRYNSFHNILRAYFMNYVNFHDIEMIKTLARAIYFLKDQERYYGYTQGEIISASLNRNLLLSIIKRHTKELISELEWRINRINPNDHFSYFPADEEIKGFFKAIYLKSFNLLNKKKFNENSKEIYLKLVPRFLDENTTVEELHKLFSGNSEIFVERIVWTGYTNELRYFLRKLKDKLRKREIFKIAERLFKDSEGKNFQNLNNTSKPPTSKSDIHVIIDLF